MSEYTSDPGSTFLFFLVVMWHLHFAVLVFNKITDADYFDFDESSSQLSMALEKFFATPRNGKISTWFYNMFYMLTNVI